MTRSLFFLVWKTGTTDGKFLEQMKAVLKPLTTWVATFAGAVGGAVVLMKVAAGGDTRWMFWPVGVLQMLCFVTHDCLCVAAAKATAKAAARRDLRNQDEGVLQVSVQ